MKEIKAAEPLDAEAMDIVKAEIDRQRILRQLVRVAVGNSKTAADYHCMTQRAKYDYQYSRGHGQLFGAILTVWCCVWYATYMTAEYLMEWVRNG